MTVKLVSTGEPSEFFVQTTVVPVVTSELV